MTRQKIHFGLPVINATWCRDERAVTSIEYALIASLIAIVILGAVATTGENLSNAYSYVANCVQNLQCS